MNQNLKSMLLIFNFIMIIIISKVFLALGKCISARKYPVHLDISIICIEQKYMLVFPWMWD